MLATNLRAKLLFFLCLTNFLAQAQLIKDKETLSDIQKQLIIQKKLANAKSIELFGKWNTQLIVDEQQALDFLYAYMPLSDLADYDRIFFLDNARISIKARNEMPWGKSIPEDVFLHFVLPLRVNNENLDSFRILMYNELKSRVKGLSMQNAVLELNHWCHEKVAYKAADERTSSPLSTMKYSFGRCGEESTFTVNTLRAIGIPARQVYTPRWAHTDDNHAWVEAWVDGKWYYLGACEPEPELNMGWFSAPATRAMLMNTRAYGWYKGSEPIIEHEARFSELNLIENYAPTKKVVVRVLDTQHHAVENARVEFQLYNYAEFYPLTKSFTDKNGLASINTGFGDLMIWADKGSYFAYKKITTENVDTIELQLTKDFRNGTYEEFDYVPPVERDILKVSPEGRAQNNRRLQYEDSVRNNYMKSFKDSAWTLEFAKTLKINTDSTINYIIKSYGNWFEIKTFLENTSPNDRSFALKLLAVISAKDLRDTKASILNDHLNASIRYIADYKSEMPLWEKYILSGRVANENMVAYKEFLIKNFKISKSNKTQIPDIIKNWTIKNITIDAIANAHSRAPLTPVGVFRLRVADSKSRDIFYVAVCRTFGIAARLQPETAIPQIWQNGKWKDIIFNSSSADKIAKGFLNLKNTSSFDPKYSIHFTLALFNNGVYRTLQFEEEKALSTFGPSTEVPAGNYMLVTGNRQQNGSVLCRVEYFEVKADETKEIKVKVRDLPDNDEIWGQIKLEDYSVRKFKENKEVKLNELTDNKSFILIMIEPDKEPSKHVMADLQTVKSTLEKWNGAILFMLKPDNATQFFKPEMFPGLPLQSVYIYDVDNKLMENFNHSKSCQLGESMPVIIMGDPKGNLTYFSKGYRIGVGEQLVKKLK